MRRSTHAVFVSLAAIAAAGAIYALSIGVASAAHGHRASGTTLTTEKTKWGIAVAVSGRRALYLFAKDKNGQSSCYGKCAAAWPPLVASGRVSVASGSGLDPKLVGTVKRTDGKTQVTYNHHPLYFYSKDKKAGDTKGESVKQYGARWYLVGRKGKELKRHRYCNGPCGSY